jgi:hypothetical protein
VGTGFIGLASVGRCGGNRMMSPFAHTFMGRAKQSTLLVFTGLCVFCVAIWMWSLIYETSVLHRGYRLEFTETTQYFGGVNNTLHEDAWRLVVVNGVVGFSYSHHWNDLEHGLDGYALTGQQWKFVRRSNRDTLRSGLLGFGWRRDAWVMPRAPGMSGESLAVRVPIWMFVVLSGIWPAMAAMRTIRRWRRPRRGLCVECGYDLRAHHPGQKGSECGTEVPAQAGAADLIAHL